MDRRWSPGSPGTSGDRRAGAARDRDRRLPDLPRADDAHADPRLATLAVPFDVVTFPLRHGPATSATHPVRGVPTVSFSRGEANGHDFRALRRLEKLDVGEVGEWSVRLPAGSGADEVAARVVALRLPAPLAAKAERRVRRIADKKGKKIDPRTIAAAHLVMLFTTIPVHLLDAEGALALYRYRWQIEVAFKRLEQLLRLVDERRRRKPQLSALSSLPARWILG